MDKPVPEKKMFFCGDFAHVLCAKSPLAGQTIG
jgi:hypothetical protein